MDEQKSFLERHGFAIAGVALPILVVVAFALVRTLPRILVEKPRYDLVYSAVSVYSNLPQDVTCEIAAVDGRVRARWSKVPQPVYVPTMRVYRLDAASGDEVEIAVPEPADLAAFAGTQDLYLGGLEGVRIDTSPRAPDGYKFETSYAGGSGLFGELFFRGSRGPRSTIAKRGRVIEVTRANQVQYGGESVTFIGWAIPIESGQ